MEGTLTITIDLGNEAMRETEDIADAVDYVRQAIADGKTYGKVRDVNGNTVGTFNTEED